MNIEVQDIETYRTFVVPFNNNELNLPMHNDSVITNTNTNIGRGYLYYEEITKDS